MKILRHPSCSLASQLGNVQAVAMVAATQITAGHVKVSRLLLVLLQCPQKMAALQDRF